MINFPELRRAWVDVNSGVFTYGGKKYEAKNPRTSYVILHDGKIVAEVFAFKTCQDLYNSLPDSIPILLLPMGSMVTD